MMKITSEAADFRTYEPEWLSDGRGHQLLMQLCEDRVGGRWEPFYSILATRDA